jgi:hypothetical protein
MRQRIMVKQLGTTRSYGILRHSRTWLVHPLMTALLVLAL